MALTPKYDLWSPDTGTEFKPTIDTAAMQDTVEAALDTKADKVNPGLLYTRNADYTWAASDPGTLVVWDNIVINSPDFTYSGGTFTCVTPGIYALYLTASIGGSATPGQIAGVIRMNGVPVATGFAARGTAHIQTVHASSLRNFNPGDTFSATVVSDGQATAARGGGQANSIMVWRVR